MFQVGFFFFLLTFHVMLIQICFFNDKHKVSGRIILWMV